MITPNNKVYLLDTPLDYTQKNQLRFSTRTAQRDYFFSCDKREIDHVDYIKKDNKFTIDGQLDDYWRYNYVMYQNSDYNDRWFYAFITKMEWESERSFSIYIKTDVYQTWRQDCEILDSFVVREHVDDDTIGKHIVDEGIEYGDYIVNSYDECKELNDIAYVMGVSDTIGSTDTVIKEVYDNVYSGIALFVYFSEDYQSMTTHINNYVNAGKPDAIQFIYVIPRICLPSGVSSGDVIPSGTTADMTGTVHKFKTFADTNVTAFKKLDGYTPLNNKLYCYPYNVLYASNRNGGSAVYRFEFFEGFPTSDELFFFIEGNVSPNPTVIMYPGDYKKSKAITGALSNPEYGIELNGYPFCSWNCDTYNAWLAQNSVSAMVTVASSELAIAGGVATGNALAVGGGILAVTGEMAQIYRASIQPDQAKGNTSGSSLNVSANRHNFLLSRMSITKTFAERIDKFFTMFGYKVNMLKVPCEYSRTSWNYIQTIDINITGHIPSEDMKELKDIYNNGVTLWHNADKFCNYGYLNEIR